MIPLSGPSNNFPLQSTTSSDGGTSGRSWHLGALKTGGVTDLLVLSEYFASSQDTGVTEKILILLTLYCKGHTYGFLPILSVASLECTTFPS